MPRFIEKHLKALYLPKIHTKPMNILFINWTGGENDPFSYFNKCLISKFKSLGSSTWEIALENNFIDNIHRYQSNHFDLAITHQGFGTHLLLEGKSLWRLLDIPIVSMHGDFPCYAPEYHTIDDSYITRFYGAPSFVRYANKYFVRKNRVRYLQPFNWFPRQELKIELSQKYFVLPKNNLVDSEILEKNRENFNKAYYDFLMECSKAIEVNFLQNNSVSHHDVIDDMIEELLHLKHRDPKDPNVAAFCHGTQQLLGHVRGKLVIEYILAELQHFPLLIIGRGWDRYKERAPSLHKFKDAWSVSEMNYQFTSDYGIIDIPNSNDTLHDRTLRAVSHNSGFLCGSHMDFTELLGSDFSTLFFGSARGHLSKLASEVMMDAQQHRDNTATFGRAMNSSYSFYDFYSELCLLRRP